MHGRAPLRNGVGYHLLTAGATLAMVRTQPKTVIGCEQEEYATKRGAESRRELRIRCQRGGGMGLGAADRTGTKQNREPRTQNLGSGVPQ